MSFDFNYKYWINTKKYIKDLIQKQNILKNVEPTADPIIIFDIISQMFILYVELVSKLSYCYRQTFQVQKKDALRNLIEPSLQRLLELKNKLKKLEFSDYIYLDKSLITRNLTPYNLLIWNFEYFIHRRPIEIEKIIWKYKHFGDKWKIRKITIKEFVTLIQSHERARQARRYKCEFEFNPNNLKVKFNRNIKYTFNYKSDQHPLVPVRRTMFNTNFIKPFDKCCNFMETSLVKDTKTECKYYMSILQQ